MSRQIVVRTGARLHFGLFAHGTGGTRPFGGVGLMIDEPGYELCAAAAERFAYTGPADLRERVEQCAANYRERCPEDGRPPQVSIDVRHAIPPHIGLGSGTQLGMAVAKTLALLAHDDAADSITLAQRVGRGARSAVGVHGFGLGGLIVDGGKKDAASIGTLVCRVDFPAEWRFVLVTPRQEAGVSGAVESDAFARLPPIAAIETDRLCGIVVRKLLPAVIEADFEACAQALHKYGSLVGTHFAPLQGGIYASRQMEVLAAHLQRAGIHGVGQTSWGPTIFALCSSAEEADLLRTALMQHPHCADCDLRVVAPMNTGAVIQSA